MKGIVPALWNSLEWRRDESFPKDTRRLETVGVGEASYTFQSRWRQHRFSAEPFRNHRASSPSSWKPPPHGDRVARSGAPLMCFENAPPGFWNISPHRHLSHLHHAWTFLSLCPYPDIKPWICTYEGRKRGRDPKNQVVGERNQYIFRALWPEFSNTVV